MWPNLKLPPINLWNVPYMFKEKTILDKIFDDEFRYYCKYGKYAEVVYIGKNQYNALKKALGVEEVTDDSLHGLDIIRVELEDYMRVG